MEQSLFEASLPSIDATTAEEVARSQFGIVGSATPLDGERDRNFRIDAEDQAYALKVGNIADSSEAVEMQILAMEHAIAADPTLPIPVVIRTVAGTPVGVFTNHLGDHPVQLVTFLSGRPPRHPPTSPEFRRSIGTVVARLSRATRGFDHPASHRHLLWDVALLPELEPQLAHVDEKRRPLIERGMASFGATIGHRLAGLPSQLVYGDAHSGNLLVDPSDPDRVVGLVDFGDVTHGARVLDVAITAAYQAFKVHPVDAFVQVVAAYHAIDALEEAEIELIPDLALARLVQSYLIGAWRSAIHPANSAYILSDSEDSWNTIVALDSLDRDATVAELRLACGLSRPRRAPLPEAVALRQARLGPALSLSYEDPVRLDSGDGVWLVDTDGNRLLDAYNNVPHVGHCHPQVTSAIAAQVRRLATNTRYLVDEVSQYADDLGALLPGDLSVVMFVNSGSEANDVAYQIARAVTGRRGVVFTEHAYHGTTFATSNMSPEELGHSVLEPWAAHVPGAATLGSPGASGAVAGELDRAFATLKNRGEAPAMVIFDDVFSSDGIFAVPPGYLETAYARARTAGALCVADEVQAGFGRVGSSFWGFAQDAVIPDIVTLGKPMGNGYPMGAVITTPTIAREFSNRWHFFSTFAGSPVAAAAGAAVLDVLRREGLPKRADDVGDYLRRAIRGLAHPSISAVRGPGLFIGVEMATALAAGRVVEGLRRRNVLTGTTGPRNNVLKIRPPMVFSERHADILVLRLTEVLASLG